MKAIRRFFIILAFLLIIAGVGLVTVYGVKTGFKFKAELVTNTHDDIESFDSLDLDIDIADVEFINSDSIKVVCIETEKLTHSVKVENNTLKINYVDELKWYEKIFGLPFRDTKIEVYFPYNHYQNLTIKSSTGDIVIPSEYSFDKINVTLSTGDAKIKASANEFNFTASTGELYLENSRYAVIESDATLVGHCDGE